jgi:uncharacterized membrane protein YhhN
MPDEGYTMLDDCVDETLTLRAYMPRIILLFAIVIGLGHVLTFSSPTDETLKFVWKFASVGTLALYAAICARNLDGWLITGVMLFSALSDIFLVTIGDIPGALSFIVADCIAIWIYCRHLRSRMGAPAIIITSLFIIAASGLAYMLPADRAEALGIAIFTIPLAAMAAFANLSRFPRYLVGLGAAMVLGSDLLIFARMGVLKDIAAGAELVWLLYFVGEVLVVMGVTRALRLKTANSQPVPVTI